MLIPPRLRPGVTAPSRPGNSRIFRHRIRGFVLLLRVLLLCFNTAAHADKALPVTPTQKPASNFLEAVATDYAHSQLFNTVEGIAPVREPRAVRDDSPPAPPQAPAPINVMTPAQGNLRRVNAQ